MRSPRLHLLREGCAVMYREGAAQFALEHLAGARERKRFGSDVHAAWTFVAGYLPLAERDDLSGMDVRARVRNHEGMDGLAPSLAGNADHGALRHRRMLRDDVLHFHGIDVLAAGNDHVLHAIDQIDITFVVHVAAVAGVHPAVDDGVGGFFRLFPVAHHDVLAAHRDFADHAGCDRFAVGIDDPDLAADRGAATGALPGILRGVRADGLS